MKQPAGSWFSGGRAGFFCTAIQECRNYLAGLDIVGQDTNHEDQQGHEEKIDSNKLHILYVLHG